MRMRTVGAIAAAMWVMSATATAEADEGAPATSVVSAPPPPPLHWYGYQTLAVDAAFDAAYFVGTNVKFPESCFLTAMGVFVPLFTGLAVHGFHARSGGVLVASFLLRLALPLMGGLATMRPAPSSCSTASNDELAECPLAYFPSYTGFAPGYGGGMLAAQLVDDGALSWEPVTKTSDTASRPSGSTWSPRVGSVRTLEGSTVTTFGVGGTF